MLFRAVGTESRDAVKGRPTRLDSGNGKENDSSSSLSISLTSELDELVHRGCSTIPGMWWKTQRFGEVGDNLMLELLV